jgi:uncharacterized protein (TIGR03089 family)
VRTAVAAVDVLPAGALAPGAERPVLTYLDDATGERTDLTAAALGGWAARTAAVLRDGCGLAPGDRVAVLLPPHWQTAAVLLGAWSAGIAVSFRPWATAGLPPIGAGSDDSLGAVFVSHARLHSWLETVPEADHRFVLGLDRLDPVPDGYLDYLVEVCRYPDVPPAYQAIRPTDPASPDGTSYQQWATIAGDIAASLDLRRGDRLLVDVAEHEQPVEWLLAPLAVGASVVLVANLDPRTRDARIAAEGVTRVL